MKRAMEIRSKKFKFFTKYLESFFKGGFLIKFKSCIQRNYDRQLSYFSKYPDVTYSLKKEIKFKKEYPSVHSYQNWSETYS